MRFGKNTTSQTRKYELNWVLVRCRLSHVWRNKSRSLAISVPHFKIIAVRNTLVIVNHMRAVCWWCDFIVFIGAPFFPWWMQSSYDMCHTVCIQNDWGAKIGTTNILLLTVYDTPLISRCYCECLTAFVVLRANMLFMFGFLSSLPLKWIYLFWVIKWLSKTISGRSMSFSAKIPMRKKFPDFKHKKMQIFLLNLLDSHENILFFHGFILFFYFHPKNWMILII